MPKRTIAYPSRSSKGEQRMNSHKQYDKYIKQPSNINPVFLEKHYEAEANKK
jgi:hypothetical protein